MSLSDGKSAIKSIESPQEEKISVSDTKTRGCRHWSGAHLIWYRRSAVLRYVRFKQTDYDWRRSENTWLLGRNILGKWRRDKKCGKYQSPCIKTDFKAEQVPGIGHYGANLAFRAWRTHPSRFSASSKRVRWAGDLASGSPINDALGRHGELLVVNETGASPKTQQVERGIY